MVRCSRTNNQKWRFLTCLTLIVVAVGSKPPSHISPLRESSTTPSDGTPGWWNGRHELVNNRKIDIIRIWEPYDNGIYRFSSAPDLVKEVLAGVDFGAVQGTDVDRRPRNALGRLTRYSLIELGISSDTRTARPSCE
jgi:hypothetical protein